LTASYVRLTRVRESLEQRTGVTVRPEVAKRVAKAVLELDYEPDETARALRGGKSRTLGVVFPKVSNIFFSQALQLIGEGARRRGYTVVPLTHEDSLEQQNEDLLTLRRCRAEGVIVTGAPGTTLQNVRSALPHMPIVALDSFFSPEIESVHLQNRQAARAATKHLLDHGYRSIACVYARPDIFSYRERSSGYADAMTAQGLSPQFLCAEDYPHLEAEIRTQFSTKWPEALLVLSDVAALTVLGILGGLPALTVVRQPIARMMEATLSALFRQIDNGAAAGSQTISIPGELVIRQSCGCP
jgi:LacI family transcriptional regulator